MFHLGCPRTWGGRMTARGRARAALVAGFGSVRGQDPHPPGMASRCARSSRRRVAARRDLRPLDRVRPCRRSRSAQSLEDRGGPRGGVDLSTRRMRFAQLVRVGPNRNPRSRRPCVVYAEQNPPSSLLPCRPGSRPELPSEDRIPARALWTAPRWFTGTIALQPIREGRLTESFHRECLEAGTIRSHHEESSGGEDDVPAVRRPRWCFPAGMRQPLHT
jgi:hypothetical protein